MTRRLVSAAATAMTALSVLVWLSWRAAAAPMPAGPSPAPPASVVQACLPVVGCNPVGRLAGDSADAIGRAVFANLGSWVADGARSLLGELSAVISPATKVQLDAAWFTAHFDLMRELAALTLLPLVIVGLVGAVIHRDPARLGRAFGFYLPVAVIGGALAVQLTILALAVTDKLTEGVAGNLGASTNQALQSLAGIVGSLSTPAAPGAGGLLGVLVMLLLIAGAMVIWIELLLRESAIYVVVLFLPIALSGLVWPVTARWTRRMIESLVALILSKFVIVAVISLAVGMIASHGGGAGHGGASSHGGVDALMAGAALLMLAGFAPFALLRLAPVVEAGVIGHLEGMERRPVAAGTSAAKMATGQLFGAAEGAGAARMALDSDAGPATITAPPTRGGQLNDVPMSDANGLAASSGPAAGGGSESFAGSGEMDASDGGLPVAGRPGASPPTVSAPASVVGGARSAQEVSDDG